LPHAATEAKTIDRLSCDGSIDVCTWHTTKKNDRLNSKREASNVQMQIYIHIIQDCEV
jgi:hypothetical protein